MRTHFRLHIICNYLAFAGQIILFSRDAIRTSDLLNLICLRYAYRSLAACWEMIKMRYINWHHLISERKECTYARERERVYTRERARLKANLCTLYTSGDVKAKHAYISDCHTLMRGGWGWMQNAALLKLRFSDCGDLCMNRGKKPGNGSFL